MSERSTPGCGSTSPSDATSDEAFVDAAFGLVLRRPPDAEARERALTKLAEGTLSRATLLQELVTREEFERVRQLDDVVAFARGARERGRAAAPSRRPRRAPTSALVEVPWVLSRLRTGRVLEVGYAFAEPAYIAALVEADPGELVGADLAAAEVPGFETVVADARVAAVSGPVVRPGAARLDARAHRRRQRGATASTASPTTRVARPRSASCAAILRPAGSLLVTVPLGEPGDYGWFRQEDVRGWTRLFTDAGFFVEEQEAYELGEEGWRSAPTFDPRRRRLRHAWPGGVSRAVCGAQPAAAAAARLSRRRAAHRPAPARPVVPQAARHLERRARRSGRLRHPLLTGGSWCQSVILPSVMRNTATAASPVPSHMWPGRLVS